MLAVLLTTAGAEGGWDSALWLLFLSHWESIVFSTDRAFFRLFLLVSSNGLLSFMWLLWLYIIYKRLKWTKWILKSSFIPCLERSCSWYSQDVSFINLLWNASPAVLFVCCGHWIPTGFSYSAQSYEDVSCCSSFQPRRAYLWKDLLPVRSQWREIVSGLLHLWLSSVRLECKC